MPETTQTPEQLMAAWMAQVVCCEIRGTIACFPHVQVEKVLILFAAVVGQQLANTYAGDELAVFKMRKAMKDAFIKAMNETKITSLTRDDKTQAASISAG